MRNFSSLIFDGIEAEKNELAIRQASENQWRSYEQVLEAGAGAWRKVGAAVEQTREKLSRAAKDISASLQKEIPSLIGTATTYKETFTLSPNELQKIAASWARIARTIASDLRAIARADLTPAMREAISALPPEMRNAWVRGNDSQRQAIQNSIKTTYKIQDQIPALARQALTGGKSVGGDMARGIAEGINAGAPGITAAAEHAVLVAIAAARRAAQAASPSKKMRLLGLDLMKGLEQGIGAGLDGVISALMSAEGDWTKAWLRQAKTLQAVGDKMLREFDKLQAKVKEFRSTIRGAFDIDLIGGLLGIDPESGVTPAQYLADQVAAAEAFGKALKQLQAAGASKGLLADLASKGIDALPLAQQLLADPALMAQLEAAFKQIADAAPVDKLVEGAFGPALDRAAERALEFADQLAEFTKALQAEALEHEVDDVVRALRRLSNQLGGGGGGGGGNGDSIWNGGSFEGVGSTTVIVNGDVLTEGQLVDKIHEGLLKKRKRNGTLELV